MNSAALTHQFPTNPPDGLTCSIAGGKCRIDQIRRGMGCLVLFLGVWLIVWTFACVSIVRGYFAGGRMDDGSLISIMHVILFLISWVVMACFFLYLVFARTSIRLHNDAMHIETSVLFVCWSVSLPRDSITRVRQTQDGGVDEDCFPSWGLEVKSAAEAASLIQRLIDLNHLGRNIRDRTILAKSPYDHSVWLGKLISEWAQLDFEGC